MDDLFRFLVLRNPLPARDIAVHLGEGEGESPFLAALAAAQGSPQPQQKMHEVALGYAQSQPFLRDAAKLDLAKAITAFGSALDQKPDANPTDLARLIETAFGQDPRAVAASDKFNAGWRRLRDSLVAVKLAPEAAPPALPSLVEAARLMALVRRVAQNDPALDEPGAVAAARAAPLALPASAVLPAPFPLRGPDAPASDAESLAEKRRSAIERVASLRRAIEAVRAYAPEPETPPAVEPPAVRPGAEAVSTLRADRRIQPITTTLVDANPVSLSRSLANSLPDVAKSALGIRSGEAPLLTVAEAEVKLKGAYRLSLADAIWQLDKQGYHDLAKFFPGANLKPVTEPGEHDDAADPAPTTMTDVPKTHGTLKPAGVGDLLVTRQHTVRYEMGEVAHIENVAGGEALTRETRRLDTTETTTVQESETFTDDQRDLQTAGRFNLQQEAENVVKSDHSRIPGQPSSDSYGSLVESGGSKQSSTKDAETYSRDITSRATTRITQRVRTQVTTRTLRELEEKATHAFTGGAAAEIIVYQWVDRVVQAQVFNYGKRLFYDIVVPEPAAFMARALESRPRELPLPPRPASFTLKPTLLNEWNWDYYVAGYGASGVAPPPPPEVTVARTFSGIAQNPFSDSDELRFAMMASGIEMPIPEGYQARKVKARVRWSGWGGYLDLVVGYFSRRFIYGGGDWHFESNLNSETGSIPITVMVPEGQAQFTIAIEVICELTDERMTRWQANAHAGILSAARERLAEYEQQLSNLRAALRLLTSGKAVGRKNSMVRQEIQKACLEVMTAQHFDGLSAVEHSPQGYPQPYLPNVEQYGRYLRFLEHAFEWEQMTWRYAPYFWGRKPYWVQALLRDDPDPAFADFLQAGAARALVSVRPGFEASVLAFMLDGTVPTLDALTEITSPLYLPLLQELREPDTALDTGKPYGDSWELRLPTTLVALRRDGTLPRWEQKVAADGTAHWVAIAGDAVP